MPVPLQALLGLWLAGVVAAAFLWVPPAKGFQEARLVIFHVPCAMLAVLAYVVSVVYAIVCLARQSMAADMRSAIAAGLGFLFTALATVTGVVFAYNEWGKAWNWDPRETSILMLMVVYAAYFALRGAIPIAQARARVSAAYNILAGLVMPFFVFVMPRIYKSLHPSDTIANRSGLAPEYRIVMGCAMLGFVLLFVWLFRLRVRVAELAAARKKR